ncbi:MAG: TonB-dependent receptor [Opitutae bacterium]|nr:TonB-dependent receptor [Opitutae bacterium]
MHPAPKSAITRRFLLRGLVAGLLLTQPALNVFAQTPAAEPAKKATAAATDAKVEPETVKLDPFVVSGIRAGIEASIATKNASNSIVESITAEDIGKLPDISIAESIARLPGLAAQRVAGRAQVISVRGLAPDFATTLLNGREQVSTGDNRGVEFDQYPSELINSVTVYKTPDASLVGQGLSGTLDLETVKPLSYSRRAIALNVRGEYNSVKNLGSDSKHTGNRYSVTYIDQSADKTMGIAFGYAHLESPIIGQEFGTYGWHNGGISGVPGSARSTDGLKLFARSGTNTRDGFIGVFEYRPTDAFTMVIDAYYSKFRREETARGLETHIGGYNNNESAPAPGMAYSATTISNGILVGGTVTGVNPLVRGIYNDRRDKLTAFGWNGKYRFEKWILVGDASYSRAERNELNLETQAHFRNGAGNFAFDNATYNLGTGGFPTATFGQNYTDVARVQVGNTIYGAGYGKVPYVKDTLKSYRVSASRGLEKFFDNVEFGLNYGNRTKDKAQPEAGLSVPGAAQSLTGDVQLGNTNLGFIGGAPSVLSWNVPAVLAKFYNPFVPSSDAFGYLIQKTWKVDEKIATYYTQFNLNQQLGSVRMRGNIGVQAKSVDQSSTSKFFDNSRPAGQQVRLNTDGKKYTDFLPSANLAFEFEHDQVLRLAAAKQVARPRLDQLKSALEFGIDNTTRLPGGSGGNPRLDPWRATAFDVSYEKYFANKKGYVAIAGFYKDLKTFIFEQTDPNYDFSRFLTGNNGPIQAITPIGRFNQPLNGRGGSLKGVELSASLPLKVVSDVLDGFGLVASYSNTSSQITIDNTNLGSSISLPGLSKTVTNLTVYYEKSGFSARVSQRYRSDFIGEISGFGSDRELRFVKNERLVDAQIGYEFQSGAFKGLGVLLQAYNLTDASYKTYQVTQDQLVEFQKYGRTYLFGLNYKF